eukprot:TRINITY_DN2569_c3_g1_i1.p1 TRINITY_DN2569_c3_g1~~TRINITY_DN2569_c3_g1_i1.p1  ORF type:complete len:105 (+),score=7.22 TRINITY_DN2569_c3_g1_i1:1-315(+)
MKGSTILLIVSLLVNANVSKLVGLSVVPHGDFAYDPSLVDYKNGSMQLHKSCEYVGDWITSLQPDIIFLSTPHGLALSNDFALYRGDRGTLFHVYMVDTMQHYC